MKAQSQQPHGFVTNVNTSTADGSRSDCPPPVVVQQPARNSHRVDKYQHRQSIGLGVTLIIFGVASIVLNGVGFAVSDKVAHVSHGFYCGAMFILTGSFGIAAARKNKCLIIAFMVLAIITAVLTIELLTVGLIGSVHNSENCGANSYGYCSCTEDYYEGYGYLTLCATSYLPPCNKGAIAIEALLAILALAAAIVSIWGSAICCRAVCCCRSSPPSYGTVPPINYVNPQVMVFSQHQSSNFAYGSGQQQAFTGYNNYNPAPQQYQYNYWTSPAQFQSQFPYPIGAQAVPPESVASTAVCVPMAPPGYTETLAAVTSKEADKK